MESGYRLRAVGALWRIPLALLFTMGAATPEPARASFFDDIFGSTLHRICRAMDGTSDGCVCAEKYILDTMSTPFLPIVEAHLTGNAPEKERLLTSLGVIDRLALGAQLTTVGTAGVFECRGARGFLLAAASAG